MAMTLIELQLVRKALRSQLARYESIVPCCHTCERMTGGRCEQFGPVPEEFQREAEACTEWVHDEIPF